MLRTSGNAADADRQELPREHPRQLFESNSVQHRDGTRTQLADTEKIEVNDMRVEKCAVVIRNQTLLSISVGDPSDLVQTPAKRGPRIVRNLPEHFTKMVSPHGTPDDGQIAEQGARLL